MYIWTPQPSLPQEPHPSCPLPLLESTHTVLTLAPQPGPSLCQYQRFRASCPSLHPPAFHFHGKTENSASTHKTSCA